MGRAGCVWKTSNAPGRLSRLRRLVWSVRHVETAIAANSAGIQCRAASGDLNHLKNSNRDRKGFIHACAAGRSDSHHGSVWRAVAPPAWRTPAYVGECSDTTRFEHAVGHPQKNATYHGLLCEHGPESDNLPNISVAAEDSACVDLYTSLMTRSELHDADGSALVVRAQSDDHVSQPIGNCGDRVNCAVITSQGL